MNSNKAGKTVPSLRFHQLAGSVGLSNPQVHSSHLLQGTSGVHSSVSNSYRYSTSITSRSVDAQRAYDLVFNSWDTLSAGIADKIRSGSLRYDRSAQFSAIQEERTAYGERHPLLPDEFTAHTKEDERVGISWVAVAFGLANASIGVGILNHPYLYSRIGGIGLSILIQAVLLLVLFLSMAIIIYCSDLYNSCSYHEVLSSICGEGAKKVIAADIALATYGICIAYLVIIGDQYDRLFASLIGPDFCKYWYLNRKVMIAVTSLCIYPICLLRRLDFLKHTGPLGMFAMLYVVFLSFYEHLKNGSASDHIDDMVMINSTASSSSSSNQVAVAAADATGLFELLSCIPVILFGYQCNEVIVPIYASLKHRNLTNFLKAAIVAYASLFVLYCTVGIFGYLTYGSSVAANVMLMFNASDPAVLLGVFALIFKMIVTYPQMAFAGREAIDDITCTSTSSPSSNVHDAIDMAGIKEKKRLTTSTIWFITSVLLSAFAPHIGIVLELLGTLASFNVFICPAICLFFLACGKIKAYSTLQRIFMFAIATLMTFVGLCFLTFVLVQVYIDVAAAVIHGSTSLCVL